MNSECKNICAYPADATPHAQPQTVPKPQGGVRPVPRPCLLPPHAHSRELLGGTLLVATRPQPQRGHPRLAPSPPWPGRTRPRPRTHPAAMVAPMYPHTTLGTAKRDALGDPQQGEVLARPSQRAGKGHPGEPRAATTRGLDDAGGMDCHADRCPAPPRGRPPPPRPTPKTTRASSAPSRSPPGGKVPSGLRAHTRETVSPPPWGVSAELEVEPDSVPRPPPRLLGGTGYAWSEVAWARSPW